MTGNDIILAIANSMAENTFAEKYKQVVSELSELPETICVMTYLLFIDDHILSSSNNSEQLSDIVKRTANYHGQFAGLEYVYEDFLDPDDVNFTAPDEGLSWVAYGDLWQALEKAFGN